MTKSQRDLSCGDGFGMAYGLIVISAFANSLSLNFTDTFNSEISFDILHHVFSDRSLAPVHGCPVYFLSCHEFQ